MSRSAATPLPLPIDAHLAAIVAAAKAHRAVVVVAPPGAGKTTRVPPALGRALGPLILLQPRRIAARAIARRIAIEEGLTLGEEVGYQVRFERRFTARTRLLVATEGVLTNRLQADPLLGGFQVVVLDEFHERSLHADLAIALIRQAMLARDDLVVVVMSATLDAGSVAEFLGGAPVLEVATQPFAVVVDYAPGLSPGEAVRRVLARPGGHLLCFLPGAGGIRRAAGVLGTAPPAADGVATRVVPLHGSLPADEQDQALAPFAGRKVVLATNIAETSLTVDGVTDVVDSGQHRLLRFDPETGIDRLEVERIPLDSADQRAGRAGRTAPGRALRLWEPGLILRPRREPEIERVDLSAPALDILAWGGDPRRFAWFEAPAPERIAAALELLVRLGAVAGGVGESTLPPRLTALGEAMRRLPLHPRLSRVLLAAGGGRRAAAAVAILSERDGRRGRGEAAVTTDSDVLLRVDRLGEESPAVRQVADELLAMAHRVLDFEEAKGGERRSATAPDDETLLRALLAGYPDRVAWRRLPGSPRLLLASGTGAVLGRESGVREGEYVVAIELEAGERGPGSEARVRTASRIERSWLTADAITTEVEHRLDPGSGAVQAVARERYGALVLVERRVAPDPTRAHELLVAESIARGPGEAAAPFLARAAFAGIALDLAAIYRVACAGRTALPRLDLAAAMSARERADLARLAPETVRLPSGREARLVYRGDGSVHLAVKLQELFGLADSPRVGARREPVVLELLAPNGRPVQTTADLRSFWERTYPAVRKELRGRYPRHPWPEDPWTAVPTARLSPRPRR